MTNNRIGTLRSFADFSQWELMEELTAIRGSVLQFDEDSGEDVLRGAAEETEVV